MPAKAASVDEKVPRTVLALDNQQQKHDPPPGRWGKIWIVWPPCEIVTACSAKTLPLRWGAGGYRPPADLPPSRLKLLFFLTHGDQQKAHSTGIQL
jgi:hypothetical protein